MADDMTQRQIYDLKRQLEELKKCRGKHTELISLYVPPSKQIFDVVSYLRNEYSQSQNIKSKTTMKNVLSAIESIMSRLKNFKQPPPMALPCSWDIRALVQTKPRWLRTSSNHPCRSSPSYIAAIQSSTPNNSKTCSVKRKSTDCSSLTVGNAPSHAAWQPRGDAPLL